MQKLFHKILLLVDFSEETTSIVDRVAEMAHQYQCHLHLLHVSPVHWLPMTGISKVGVIGARGWRNLYFE